MTKLISGKVKKTPSANVSSTRYQFLKLEEAEPDLGLPTSNGQALLGLVNGTRYWGNVSVSGGLGSETANVANSLVVNANVVLNTMSANNIVLPGFDGSNTLPRYNGNIGQIIVATGGTGAVWANKFTHGPLPPEYSYYGDMWYDTTDFKVYMWVTDGVSDYWFDFLPPTF